MDILISNLLSESILEVVKLKILIYAYMCIFKMGKVHETSNFWNFPAICISDRFVLAFLKCTDRFVLVSLKIMDGSLLAHLRPSIQSVPSRFPQLGNSGVPQLLCKKSSKMSDLKYNGVCMQGRGTEAKLFKIMIV